MAPQFSKATIGDVELRTCTCDVAGDGSGASGCDAKSMQGVQAMLISMIAAAGENLTRM